MHSQDACATCFSLLASIFWRCGTGWGRVYAIILRMDILASLNPAQRKAVEAINGPVLILAGPGSGKTRVITHRIAYLIKTVGVSPRNILAVTFTNKAAKEMQARLQQLVPGSADVLTVGTFHAICGRILRQDGHAIGIDPHFVIYDRDDQVSVVKKTLQELNLDPKRFAPSALINVISEAKSQTFGPEDYIKRGRSYFDEVAGRVYERYQQILNESKALDFDDLLMKTVLLFRKSPETLARYQNRYRHILVDEFQDTNITQYELIKQLGARYRNICVVGDPDQSIYSWRFADMRNILSFEKDYPDAAVIFLEENYRSTKMILNAASAIISVNQQRKDKHLWTNNETGEPATLVETYTEQEEAQFVVNEIDKLVSQGQYSLKDFAVMFRTNAQSRAMEEAFIRYGMSYRLVAATRFYERREVKDVIAYLRFIQNPQDNISLMRIINCPQRGIGQQTQARLQTWAKAQGISVWEALESLTGSERSDASLHPHPDPLPSREREEGAKAPFTGQTGKQLEAFARLMAEFIERSRQLRLMDLFDIVVERSGYKKSVLAEADGEERWENVQELRAVAEDYTDIAPPEGLSSFLEGVALVSDVDSLDETASAVTLITLHQAKGLEFPVVFLVGLEDGLLPHIRSFDDPAQMEEERRLLYVGMTRARQKLYLVRAFRRHMMGRDMVSLPSRFLADLPRDLTSTAQGAGEESQETPSIYDWNRPPTSKIEAKSKRLEAPTPAPFIELKAGDHVHHTQFGRGVVVSYKPINGDAEVTVAFTGEVKKLLMSFARLEKVE